MTCTDRIFGTRTPNPVSAPHRVARRLSFGVLAGAVLAQRGDRGAVQGDHSGAVPGLGRAGDDMPVQLL
jgi:hypothetical protein